MDNFETPQRSVETGSSGGKFLARATFDVAAPLRSLSNILPFKTSRVATNIGDHPIVKLFDLDDQGQKSIRANLLDTIQQDEWSTLVVTRIGFKGADVEQSPVTVLISVKPAAVTTIRAVEIANKAADYIYRFVLFF